MKTRLLSWSELVEWVKTQPAGFAMAILFGGDRLSCCDEAVGLEVQGKIVSVATIAPKGEELSGQPTIEALYTVSEFRHRGYAGMVFRAAIKRCRERGFSRVRVDVMSRYAMRLIESLDTKDRDYLDVHDGGSIMDLIS